MNGTHFQISRRAFVRNGSLFLLGAGAAVDSLAAEQVRPKFRVGLVTDLHHADKPTRGTR